MSNQRGPKTAPGQHSAHIFGVYFMGTPLNISELSGECWGGGGVTDCWGVGHWRRPAYASLAIRYAAAST